MFTLLATIIFTQPYSSNFAELLDINGDGIIQPMEASDAIEMWSEDVGVGLPIKDIPVVLRENKIEIEEMAKTYEEDFDTNGDGEVFLNEVDGDLYLLAKLIDANQDQRITTQEIIEADPDSDQTFAKLEVALIFEDLDENRDGEIELDFLMEIEPDLAEFAVEFDIDKNKKISEDEMLAGFKLLDLPASFKVDGELAYMIGTIDSSTPFRVMELVHYHPKVHTIVMVDVPGSIDDDSCIRASRIVRKHGLNTHVPSDGEVASGGTDFFQSGVIRTCEEGAKFGIHSWAELNAEGSDYPRDHEVHKMYLSYCDDMGIPQSFYWYTLEAAPAEDIHYMTEHELDKYKMLTHPIISLPTP